MSTAVPISNSDGQIESWSFAGVISENACPAATKKPPLYCASAKAWRRRNPTLELVTATVPGVLESLGLRERIVDFAIEARTLEPAELQRRFRDAFA